MVMIGYLEYLIESFIFDEASLIVQTDWTRMYLLKFSQ